MGYYLPGGMYIKDNVEMDEQCKKCSNKKWCSNAFSGTNESGCIDYNDKL